MKEVWKDVVDFEGYYQVSNIGNIRSLDRTIKNTNRKTKYKMKLKGGHKKQSLNSRGYFKSCFCKKGTLKTLRIHRLVGQAFIKNTNKKPCINHKNGIKTDNRVENLEWCTHSENVRHAWKNGLNHVPHR